MKKILVCEDQLLYLHESLGNGVGIYTNHAGGFALGMNNTLIKLKNVKEDNVQTLKNLTFIYSWRVDTTKRFIFIRTSAHSIEYAYWIVPNSVGGLLAPEAQPDKYGADANMTGGNIEENIESINCEKPWYVEQGL